MAIKKSMFRKPESRGVSLKILIYGEDGSGKSVYGLSFPDVAVLDAEGKIGVYEGDATYGRNIIGIIDSLKYKDLLDAYKEIIKEKPCKAFMTDSMTYIYNQMKVSLMELEEERAVKNGGNPDDQNVSLRGYGKLNLNVARLRGLKAEASSNGVIVIDTAHKKDIMQEIGEGKNRKSIKVGETADIAKNSRHEYDIILKMYKDKNLGTGEIVYKAIIEKDTTQTFKVGTVIENPCYDNTFKNYIESKNGLSTIKTSYGSAIDDNKAEAEKNEKSHDEVVSEFEAIYKTLEGDKKEKAKEILKTNSCAKYKDISNFDNLKIALEQIKSL